MDPVTAALNALAKFNEFLCTTEGQKLAALNNTVIAKILDRISNKLDTQTVTDTVK